MAKRVTAKALIDDLTNLGSIHLSKDPGEEGICVDFQSYDEAESSIFVVGELLTALKYIQVKATEVTKEAEASSEKETTEETPEAASQEAASVVCADQD